MTRWKWLVLGFAAVACNCESGPMGAGTQGMPAAGPPAQDLRGVMRSHYAAASDLQRAVAHGRLVDARDIAGWIAANAEPRTPQLATAARNIASAADVPAAARFTGELAGACSSCHEARGVKPVFDYAPLRAPTTVTLEDQMQRHQWAAARLWEGAIGPSDIAWTVGLDVISTTAIDFSRTTNAKPNEDVVRYGEELRAHVTRARDTNDRVGRAVIYGEMLETCANCHTIVRPRAVAHGR